MELRKNFFGSIFLLAAVILLVISAISSNQAVAAKKKVVFVALTDFTGPVSGLCVPMAMGMEDYFRYINAKGGIKGVKIEFIQVDTRQDVARTISAYRRYRLKPKVMGWYTAASGPSKAIGPLVNKDKFILITNAVDGFFQAQLGRNFITGPCYQDSFASVIEWSIKDWKAKGNSGMPVMGYFGWDNTVGHEVLHGGKEYAEKRGIKLVIELCPQATPNHNPYLKRLEKGGANYVYLVFAEPEITVVMRDAYDLGLTKKIQFISLSQGATEDVSARLYPKALEGMMVNGYLIRGQDSVKNPLLIELWTKYRKKPMDEFKGNYPNGVLVALLFSKALSKALESVDYKDLNPDEIYEAAQKLEGEDAEGLIYQIAWSKSSRRGTLYQKYYRFGTDGKMRAISDWIKTVDAIPLYGKYADTIKKRGGIK